MLVGGLHQLAYLVDRMGEWFFAIDMLASPDRIHRRDGVCVVGRADRDGIEPTVHLIQHLAKVLVRLGAGMRPTRLCHAAGIHVTQGHDILAATPIDAGAASPADADDRDVQLVAGRSAAPSSQHMRRHNGERRYSARRPLQKFTSRSPLVNLAHHKNLQTKCSRFNSISMYLNIIRVTE